MVHALSKALRLTWTAIALASINPRSTSDSSPSSISTHGWVWHVAEFGNSNVFMAKDGAVYTPAPNGTFLNGITRQRVIELLRGEGVTVIEATLQYAEFLAADEIFSTGNFAKVAPVIRIDDRQLTPGPFYARARKLYWDFAHAVKLAA
jgi:branched-chain amino acid aminotransferase